MNIVKETADILTDAMHLQNKADQKKNYFKKFDHKFLCTQVISEKTAPVFLLRQRESDEHGMHLSIEKQSTVADLDINEVEDQFFNKLRELKVSATSTFIGKRLYLDVMHLQNAVAKTSFRGRANQVFINPNTLIPADFLYQDSQKIIDERVPVDEIYVGYKGNTGMDGAAIYAPHKIVDTVDWLTEHFKSALVITDKFDDYYKRLVKE